MTIKTTLNKLTLIITGVVLALTMVVAANTMAPGRADAQEGCQTLSRDRGYLSYSIDATSSTNRSYYVWTRIKATGGNPAIVVNATSDQDSLCNSGNGQRIAANAGNDQWVWARSGGTVAWAGGSILIEAGSDMDGLGLDCVVLHSSSSFNPTTKEDCETTSPSDTVSPSVSITSPSSGATVSGQTTISVDATDDVGVASVEFRIDGILVETDNSSPYSYSWDTTQVSDSSHTISVTARDTSGNIQTETTTVTVDNVVEPPSNDPPARVTGLSASATSDSSIRLTWNVSSDPNGDSVSYRVERSSGGGSFQTIANVSSNSYSDDGLSASTQYTYQVIAYESATSDRLESSPSAPASATTQSPSCRTVEQIEIIVAISNYINGTFSSSSQLFDANNDGSLNQIEVITGISDYIYQRCVQ